jgi:inorganic pyrophosphatase
LNFSWHSIRRIFIMKLPGTFNEDGSLVNVIIETPSGSRNKYAFDPETGLFKLRKILPAGTEFPMDMGFIPGTKGEDGDPLDALVWMDFPGSVGVHLECRLLGVIEMIQKEKNKKPQRNDRFLFIPDSSHEYEHLKSIKDLSEKKLEDIEGFFNYYNSVEGKKLEFLGVKGPRKALAVIKRSLE